MVLANRYDWQLFLEVTGPGGSGKSVMAAIARLLAGADNTTSATIDNLSRRENARAWSASLIILPDQEKWSGDGRVSRPSPAAMRSPSTPNTAMPTRRTSRR